MATAMFIFIFLGVLTGSLGFFVFDDVNQAFSILLSVLSLIIGIVLMFGAVHYSDRTKINKYNIAELPSYTFVESASILMTFSTEEERKSAREIKEIYLIREYNYWQLHINSRLEFIK